MLDQLDLFYESLPDTVLVLPEKGGPTFIRRKHHAVQYPWIAPHVENVHYLIVDVDRRVTPYEIYDAHLPEPNIISLNRQSGHAQYFWHLEDPVYAWPSQRKNNSYRFYKAIQEGFCLFKDGVAVGGHELLIAYGCARLVLVGVVEA